jgi:tripartite-type tricarboxylate transporter receptor subunit TctC
MWTLRTKWRGTGQRLLQGMFSLICGIACALLAAPGDALAAFPDRPIRLVVPWPAGGSTDLGAREFAQVLSARLNTPVVVENRPGATGVVGAQFVARAPADGYTLLLATSETLAINAFTYSNLPYDPLKDFIAINAFALNPNALTTNTKFQARNVTELIEDIRQHSGKYSYSSAGLGSASQLVMEMLKSKLGLDILHVPYQGQAPAVAALMGGQTDMIILPLGNAATLRQSGKVKVYAVTTAERYPDMPDVPTFKESGFPDIMIANWFGLAAPANTPAPVIRTLAAAIEAASSDPKTIAALRGLGLLPFSPRMTQPEFQKFVNNEMGRWGDIIKRANIQQHAN